MQGTTVVKGVDDFLQEDIDRHWDLIQQGIPSILMLGLTTRDACNLRCNYCFGPDARSQESNQHIPLDEYRRLLEQAVELGAQTAIYCSNGEPFMDKDLPDVLRHSHKAGLTNAVLTNATFFGDDVLSQKVHHMSAKDLTQLAFETGTSLVISLDSLEEQKVDRIAGVPGTYAVLQKAIANIRDAGFTAIQKDVQGRDVTRVQFSAVIGKLNFHEIPNLREFAHGMGAQFVCKLPSLLGRARENMEVFFENNATTRWLRENYIVQMSDKKETVSSDDIGRCGVWHYGIVIGNDGTIRQCFSIGDIAVWNIRNVSLKELAQVRLDQFKDKLRNPGCLTKEADYAIAS